MEEWQPGGDLGLAHLLCSNEAESHLSLLVCQSQNNEIHAQAHSVNLLKKIQEESWKQPEKTDSRLVEGKQFELWQIPHQKPWKHSVFRCWKERTDSPETCNQQDVPEEWSNNRHIIRWRKNVGWRKTKGSSWTKGNLKWGALQDQEGKDSRYQVQGNKVSSLCFPNYLWYLKTNHKITWYGSECT